MSLRFYKDRGGQRIVRGLALCLGTLLTLLSPHGATTAAGPSKAVKRETRELRGVVLQVEPTRLTLQSKTGENVVLTTLDDYTQRVSVGSEVTALYYPQDTGPGLLKSLDYPGETLFVPVGEIQRRVHRLVLMQQSELADADVLYDAIRDYLHGNFGWYVAPKYLAAEVTKKAERAGSILDATDTKTGNIDFSKYLGKSQGIIPTLASQTRSDGVLQVDVIEVQAPVRRLIATWDGIDQPVAGNGMRTMARISVLPHRGEVSASTVELKLWNAKGELLWRNRRGLAVLQVLAGGNHLRDRSLPEFFNDTQAVQSWLDETFKSIGPEVESTSKPGHP